MLQHVGFLFLADVKFMDDSTIELIEDVSFTADVIDLVSQFMVDRKRLVKLLSHLLIIAYSRMSE